MNLSVQNCRKEKEWLIIPAFVCGSTVISFFFCLLRTYQSLLFFLFVNKNKGKEWKEHNSLHFHRHLHIMMKTSLRLMRMTASILLSQHTLQQSALIIDNMVILAIIIF